MPPKKLANRVALITGAGRGIGRAIALGFAREGARIAAAGRTQSDLNSLVEEVSALGGKAVAIPADLSDPAVPAKVARQAENALGSLDILVNNAGIGSGSNPKPIVDFDDEFWNLSLALNLTAPYLLCKAMAQAILQGGHVRVGWEDNPYISPGAFAKQNRELVSKVRDLSLSLGREVATPNEARKMLGLT